MKLLIGREAVAILILLAIGVADSDARSAPLHGEFGISLPDTANRVPLTGRLFLMISRHNDPEVRLQTGWVTSPPIFGLDVNQLEPGRKIRIDESVRGYPLRSIRDIPSGDYYVQALLNVYTQFHRADGHTIWAHMDQWEGQQFNIAPGNLYSKPKKIHLDASKGYQIQIELTDVIPAIQVTPDTPWVKHVKLRSELLSKFWGHSIYLGATVLLPHGYEQDDSLRYPVVYEQGHFSLDAPLGFGNARAGDQRKSTELSEAWMAGKLPRMIAVTFQHPTPYYDESFAINSPNNGPYQDAIMQELIPYIDEHFRTIRESYARVLTGASAGGLNSLILQIHHPDFFGGTWSFSPAEIDMRSYYVMDIYSDKNAFSFVPKGVLAPFLQQEWTTLERYILRTEDGQPIASVRQISQLEAVLGSKGRSAFWFAPSDAAYGPVGVDGYPESLFDLATGKIDSNIARYWHDQGHDLRSYAEENWTEIGPKLVGKLHIYVGEMDEFYVNSGVYLFENFLKETTNPYYGGSFEYGRPMKGHAWLPMSAATLIEKMADYIAKNAPAGANVNWH